MLIVLLFPAGEVEKDAVACASANKGINNKKTNAFNGFID
jgi:hypothetical protein